MHMDNVPRVQYETFYTAEKKAVMHNRKVHYVTTLVKVCSFLFLVLSAALVFNLERQRQSLNSSSSLASENIAHVQSELKHGKDYSIYNSGSGQERKHRASPKKELLPDKLLALWSEWGEWSGCSKRKYCHEGTQTRKRSCFSLDEKSNCVGVTMESRDCPDSSCLRRTHSLADAVEVATSSFIGQECNSTEKYSATGKYTDEVLDVVYRHFPGAKRMLKSGFFAVQEIPHMIDKESDITKICFEPQGSWSLLGARRAFQLNRSTRASLGIRHKSTNVLGITVGLYPDDGLYGVALATGTSSGWYDKIYYRRWKGKGFPGNFLF